MPHAPSSGADGAAVTLAGPAGPLEGRWHTPPDGTALQACALMTHPQPVMGGTMASPVVVRVTRALAAAGCGTLRFNFRGVGASGGHHAGGAQEAHDVGAAVTWLADRHPGLPLLACGYSFGAMMVCRWAPTDARVHGCVVIGFPLTMGQPLPDLGDRPMLCIQGAIDRFGDGPAIEAAAAASGSANVRVVIIPGAEHLFPGRTQDVAAAAAGALGWLTSAS